ncbi:hypothetical protein W822_21850 [Advenella kashmirensis W13003]|uniref:MxaA protein n=1 Tax=Advenella kashmirensis W13003 TaxID=1424334 RepID=V8QLP2_9BURK|nr:hypothetical protein [Advenella kashmirensis]ETF00547.1 hypothetical protein W822_21850 [Advenella kashmirensis W13003]
MRGRIWPFLRLIVALFLVAVCSQGQAADLRVQVAPLRPAGWLLGDVVPVTIRIDSPNATLQQSSLPVPGSLNYWLDLRSVVVEQSGSGADTVYTLTLNYQTFYVPLDVNRREIPALDLLFSDGASEQTIRVPPQVFYMSPLRGVAQSGTEVSEQIRPDVPAGRIDEKPLWQRAGGLIVLVLLWLLLLSMHYSRWPFHQRQARPFARAYRAIRKNLKRADHESYSRSLIELHRALDASNQTRLMSSDVSAFVARNPRFAPVQDDLALFFTASASTFFGGAPRQTDPGLTAARLLDIASRLAATERRGL